MQILLLLLAVVLVAAVLILWAARRHAAAQERAGHWDADGPTQPTAPKDNKTHFLNRVTGRNWPRI